MKHKIHTFAKEKDALEGFLNDSKKEFSLLEKTKEEERRELNAEVKEMEDHLSVFSDLFNEKEKEITLLKKSNNKCNNIICYYINTYAMHGV